MADRRPGDFGYDPRGGVVEAPQQGQATPPVRVNVGEFGGMGEALAKVGTGISAASDSHMEAIQKRLDLNYAVQAQGAIRQGAAGIFAQAKQSMTGDKTPDDVLASFTAQSEKLREAQLKGAKTDAQSSAVHKAWTETMSVYSPRVLAEAQKAVETKSKITLDDEVANFGSSSLNVISQGDMQGAMPTILGNAELIRRAVDARVAVGLISPVEGEEQKHVRLQSYYGGIVRNMLVNPQTRGKALEMWNSGLPFETRIAQGADGKPKAQGVSLRELVGPKDQDSVEQFAQRIMEQDAMRSERDWNKRVTEERRAEERADREQRRQDRAQEKADKAVEAVFSSPRGRNAQAELDQVVGKYDPTAKTDIMENVRKRVGVGQDVIEATRDEVKIYNANRVPSWFRGSPQNAADIDSAEAKIAKDVKDRVVSDAVANMRLKVLQGMRARIQTQGGK